MVIIWFGHILCVRINYFLNLFRIFRLVLAICCSELIHISEGIWEFVISGDDLYTLFGLDGGGSFRISISYHNEWKEINLGLICYVTI